MSEHNYCKLSFPGIRCLNYEEMLKKGIGAFSFSQCRERILLLMPDKDGNPQLASLAIVKTEGKPNWAWDGNEDAPTLSPSIHNIGHWHGFLRNGRFESC